MTTYQWLCVLGIPTILLTIGGLVVGFFRSQQNQIKAVRLGIQALLRAQMIADYNKWADRLEREARKPKRRGWLARLFGK